MKFSGKRFTVAIVLATMLLMVFLFSASVIAYIVANPCLRVIALGVAFMCMVVILYNGLE